MNYYPIKMYCPFSSKKDKIEIVYFYPVEKSGKICVNIESFNGCDNWWHSCPECENCKVNAFSKIPDNI